MRLLIFNFHVEMCNLCGDLAQIMYRIVFKTLPSYVCILIEAGLLTYNACLILLVHEMFYL